MHKRVTETFFMDDDGSPFLFAIVKVQARPHDIPELLKNNGNAALSKRLHRIIFVTGEYDMTDTINELMAKNLGDHAPE